MIAYAIAEVISRADDDLTRADIFKQAMALKNVELLMLKQVVVVNTNRGDCANIHGAYIVNGHSKSSALICKLLESNEVNRQKQGCLTGRIRISKHGN